MDPGPPCPLPAAWGCGSWLLEGDLQAEVALAPALQHPAGWPRQERVPLFLGSVLPGGVAPSCLVWPRDPPGLGHHWGSPRVLTPLSLLCLFQACSPASPSPRMMAAVPRIRPVPTHMPTHLCTLYDARRVPVPLPDPSSPLLGPPASPSLHLPLGGGQRAPSLPLAPCSCITPRQRATGQDFGATLIGQ